MSTEIPARAACNCEFDRPSCYRDRESPLKPDSPTGKVGRSNNLRRRIGNERELALICADLRSSWPSKLWTAIEEAIADGDGVTGTELTATHSLRRYVDGG